MPQSFHRGRGGAGYRALAGLGALKRPERPTSLARPRSVPRCAAAKVLESRPFCERDPVSNRGHHDLRACGRVSRTAPKDCKQPPASRHDHVLGEAAPRDRQVARRARAATRTAQRPSSQERSDRRRSQPTPTTLRFALRLTASLRWRARDVIVRLIRRGRAEDEPVARPSGWSGHVIRRHLDADAGRAVATWAGRDICACRRSTRQRHGTCHDQTCERFTRYAAFRH